MRPMRLSASFPSVWRRCLRCTRLAFGSALRGAAIAFVVLAALAASAFGQEVASPVGQTVPGQTTPAVGQSTTTATTTAAPPPAAAKAPPRRPFRSARLTFLAGDVRVEQANSSANSMAVLNMPLVEGTVISSGSDGQAEIEFEDGSLAQLTPNSGLSLLSLSVDSSGNFQTRLALLGGLAYMELRAGTKYVYSVDAGGDVISPVENTTVRINFDEPPASVAVLDGTAHFASAGRSFMDATAGQTVQVDPSSDGSVLMVKSVIAPESWDRWSEDRDEAAASQAGMETGARTGFAGSQGYGWSDLDANGSWYDVPGHGEIWQPDVAAVPGDGASGNGQDTSQDTSQGTSQDASQDTGPDSGNGFDPYGYGSWAWTPAGYAWASGYGWGWLPYRCGLWSFYPGFGWGWSPDLYCGVYGFGGYGYGGFAYGGGGINIGAGPPIYRRPRRPVPGPGPIHPILRGPRPIRPMPLAPMHRVGGDRVIAGNTVQPLQPTGNALATTSGGIVGAGLLRDYPIDAKTHAPVTGLLPMSHGASAAGSYSGSYVRRMDGSGRGTYTPPTAYDGRPIQGRPAPIQRQAPSAPHPAPAPTSHPAAAASAPSPTKGR